MSSGKLVFFGTGPVSLASLKSLAENFEIEAVITKPDPKRSKDPRLVADFAETNGLPLHQPANKDELHEVVKNANFTSRYGVIVDHGMIITKATIELFELGIINSHFSLLPEWRGADPITFSLLSGQETTGVSLMLIVPALDEGDLLLQRKYQITPDETIDSLTTNLVELSNDMLLEALPVYEQGLIHPYKQDESKHASYSRKLTKSDGEIDWNKSAEQLEREVRAFLGWPGSKTEIAGKRVAVTSAEVSEIEGEVGRISEHEKKILVHCGQGSLLINSLKPDGKGEMESQAFLAGNKL